MKSLALGGACALLAACSCSNPGAGGGPDAGDGGGARADGGDAGGVFGDGGCGTPFSGAGTLLAGGLNGPRRLAIAGASLFVVESGSLFNADGDVLQVPLAGGAPQPLASGFTAPDAVAADGQGTYLVDENGLWLVPADGGLVLADGTLNNAVSGTTDLDLSSGDVVYATGLRWLVSVPRDGGAGVRLYTADAGGFVPAARIDGRTVYFLLADTPGEGLYAVPLDGSGPAALLSAAPQSGRSLSLTPDAFLWTQGNGGDGGVFSLPRDGGQATPLALGLAGPAHPLQVGDFVYFKDGTVGPETSAFLQRVSLCAPGTALPVGPTGVGLGDVAAAGASLFYSSAASGQDGFVGRLP